MQLDSRNWENSRDWQFSNSNGDGRFWETIKMVTSYPDLFGSGHCHGCASVFLMNNWWCACICTIKQQFYTWWCLDFKIRHQPSMDLRGRFALRPKIYIGYDDKKWANLWKGMIDPSLYCIGNQSIPYQVTIP